MKMRLSDLAHHARTWALAAASALALAACGGGGGDAAPPPATGASAPAESLFVPANAWSGSVPAGAEIVTPDEFRRRHAAGEAVLLTPDMPATQRAARRAHVAAELAFLKSQTGLGETMQALLAEAAAATDFEAGAVATLPGGRTVALNNLGTRIENAADALRRSRDPALALATYQLSFGSLGDELKAQLPLPATLASASIEQIDEATRQLNAALAALPDLDHTRLDPDAPTSTASAAGRVGKLAAAQPGDGTDRSGTAIECAPTGLARRYWFPLRNFVSPVKDQGERGTCWAFAAIGAVESHEQVQLGTTPNLSEQFLVNKVKLEWRPDMLNDGGSAALALNDAEDRFQRIPYEAAWTYNPARGRPDNAFDTDVVGTAASYTGTCNGYTGSCSESSHESPGFCTVLQFVTYCSHFLLTFPDLPGTGLRGSRVLPVWNSKQPFDFLVLRAHLAAGRSLIGTFPVYEGFLSAPRGVVSDFARKMKDKDGKLVDGSYGDHLAQIVGFISNEEMVVPGALPPAIEGGGYFIIRNSWGCGAGDAGYFYVPAYYVERIFTHVDVLDMLPNRSARWNADQEVPGGAGGLTVKLRDNAAATLRGFSDLAADVLVDHPAANYVRLKITSDRDGLLYDGQWLVNAPPGGSLFANSLRLKFATEGPRRLTLVARYGSLQVSTSNVVQVLNSAPMVRFETLATPPAQGENVVINAAATDLNEPDDTALCAAMTWQVSAPDVIVSGSGCSRVVRFGAAGTRQVAVGTRDPEGLTANATGAFEVTPPPANPFPRVSSFGVFSRDELLAGGQVVGCVAHAVADSTLIDLRQLACKLSILSPDTSRQFGQVVVENPTNEALSYDWSYTDYLPDGTATARSTTQTTSAPSIDMGRFLYVGLDGATASAYRCTLDLRVNAPQAARSKTLRVWSGRCINRDLAPR